MEECPVKVFLFPPERYTEEYRKHGYVLVRNGVSPEFLGYARKTLEDLVEQNRSMKEFEFAGKKQQFLFEFPKESDYPDGVFEVVARLAGLRRDKMMLCERHLKVYDRNAPSHPPPHKDRVASQVAVGIPLVVPNGSYVVLYPNDHLMINPLNTTADWRESLDEEQLPENLLKDLTPVRVDVLPGDVLLFRGSSIYHERVNGAETALVYLKFNAMRLDPLGEDPATDPQRRRSLELLARLSDEDLLHSVVDVSPRLIRISRHYTRLYWKEVVQAYVGGSKVFNVSDAELKFIMNVDGERTVQDVIERLGIPVGEHTKHLPIVRRLVRLGGIDLWATSSQSGPRSR